MRKIFALTILSILLPVSLAWAQLTPADIGINETAQEAGYSTSYGTLGTYVGARIIEPLFAIVGVVFFILIIYGGLMWMTGGGNPDNIKKARNIIVHSVLGLIVILIAYGLTRYILIALTG